MIRLTRLPASAALATTVAMLPSAICARETPRPTAAFQALLDCKGVPDHAARLSCYDAAVARIAQADTQGDIVVIDRAQATAAHRQAFGLPLPSLDFVTRALKPEEADRLEGVVRTVRADASGRWIMALEDGAVWRQIDGAVFRPPHAGSKVSIRKGVLGSFAMNIDGQAAVKVHRDR